MELVSGGVVGCDGGWLKASVRGVCFCWRARVYSLRCMLVGIGASGLLQVADAVLKEQPAWSRGGYVDPEHLVRLMTKTLLPSIPR